MVGEPISADTATFGVAEGLRPWQRAAFASRRWLVGARIHGDLPASICHFLPHRKVASGDDHGLAIFILGVALVVSPGEAHLVRWPHLCSLWSPGKLIGLGVPLRLCGNGSATHYGRLAIVQGYSVIGEPAGERLAPTLCDRFLKSSVQLKQQNDAR